MTSDSPESKITQSYRVTPATIKLLKEVADETEYAQGTILEECVLTSIQVVKTRLLEKRRQQLLEKQLAEKEKPPKRPVGRPRKNF